MIATLVAFVIGLILHSALRRWLGWFRADLIWVGLCLFGAAVFVFSRSWGSAAVMLAMVVAMLLTMCHTANCERCSS